ERGSAGAAIANAIGPTRLKERPIMRTDTRERARRGCRVIVGRGLARGFHVLGLEPVAALGRGKSCEIVIASTEVSRRHARIACEAAACTISDLGSRNGTFVNGERLATSHALADGDRIHLGDIELRFLVHDGSRDDLPRY